MNLTFVASLLRGRSLKDRYRNINNEQQWYICSNPSCKISYFNDSEYYKTNDIKVKIWFKTKSMLAPICYCSNLTRKDIKKAVENGCKTIDDVQKFTKKNITGKCKTMNVLGRCCRNVFLYEIDKSKNR